MSKNYLAIERDDKCWDHIMLVDDDKNIVFEEFLDMSYDEMKSSEQLSDFVVAVMDAANTVSGSHDRQTIVTLVGEDDIFIWSILMGMGDHDMIRYNLLDWKKDGKNYRYTP